MKCYLQVLLLLFFCTSAQSQYVYPEDDAVRRKLEKWQDNKFGLFMHWGIYSIPGIVESWSINSEHADWIPRDSTANYEVYKQWYFDLNKQFNPVNFNPAQWAEFAKYAGMKYVVFTTKHHDGFAMFDTKFSSYKITDPAVPFHKDPRANVTKEIFSAFRNQGFMIGAYFSKPDWHSEYYWWPRYATPDRNNNYDIRQHPDRWNKFKTFTHNQINELMSDYGSVDILWLDGGWVRPKSTVNAEVLSWGAPIPAWDQDIDMPAIAKAARVKQPGLIMVDRTVHGPYENYQTPEQKIPDAPLNYPWETCMTMGNAWGYVPNDVYKSTNTLVHTLIDIVAKGGNLLLDVGPKPDGTLPETALDRLKEIGDWMKINNSAIYGSAPVSPYKVNNVCFTKGKDGSIYAFYLLKDQEAVPKKVLLSGLPVQPKNIDLLGNGKVSFKKTTAAIEVSIPKTAAKHALVFKVN